MARYNLYLRHQNLVKFASERINPAAGDIIGACFRLMEARIKPGESVSRESYAFSSKLEPRPLF